ncbi:ABC transporter ATP-binding protein [Lysobacter sp. LF1]|uniref:ABC transporter ATP-binding protein n=1 Tax=Lysobacter stagni TaxID=3045172 RepID=A0ABT6XD87_9GAMM|nr:ABC transporter ATP-binding protein [Lysobacter sp. LF1]MDI9238110.1 ABC transporter ATP-binding protein [Lysobacter sp. LF1]
MNALHIESLHYGVDGQPILRGIDLSLAPGEFAALIGPNGAGKTTLLHCIAGVVSPDSGYIRIGGADLQSEPLQAKRGLGLSIDPSRLPPVLSVRECLKLFADARGLPAIPPSTLALCEALALTPVLDRWLGQCSLGTRQKVGIALGLLGEPSLLVLDEPLNGLDPPSAYALKEHLRHLCGEHGTTVLLATHSLDIAERFINRAMLMVDGRLHRDWSRQQLDAIRAHPDRSLEREMVEAMA